MKKFYCLLGRKMAELCSNKTYAFTVYPNTEIETVQPYTVQTRDRVQCMDRYVYILYMLMVHIYIWYNVYSNTHTHMSYCIVLIYPSPNKGIPYIHSFISI